MRFMLEELGKVSGLESVTLQSGYQRNAVILEHIMNAQCFDGISMLGESARGESFMERRCLSLVVNREPLLFIFWNGEKLDVLARRLLSRVILLSHNRMPHVKLFCR